MGMNKKPWGRMLMILVVISMVSFACSLPGSTEQMEKEKDLLATQSALSVEQTVMAMKQATDAAQPQQPAQQQPAQQDPPAAAPTDPPPPTNTPEPQPTDAPTATPTPDFEAWKETANILVYEDMKGNFAFLPRVDQALDALGLRGANVVRVGDAQGNFLRELNTGRGWDLVIVAGESRQAPTGEFWDVIGELVIQDDVALIAEVWDMDSYYIGKISPLLSRCGITLFRDWERNPMAFDIYDYSIYWLEPQHPVFTQPNVVEPLLVTSLTWDWDVGDLIKLKGGDAEIIAGTQKKEYSSYGLITTCMEGRVLWQTFSTHDYGADDTIALWQNYIEYTLRARFEKINGQ